MEAQVPGSGSESSDDSFDDIEGFTADVDEGGQKTLRSPGIRVDSGEMEAAIDSTRAVHLV